MKQILNRLTNHETLSQIEAKNVLINISKGDYNAMQIASFLTVFMMRSITIDELIFKLRNSFANANHTAYFIRNN